MISSGSSYTVTTHHHNSGGSCGSSGSSGRGGRAGPSGCDAPPGTYTIVVFAGPPGQPGAAAPVLATAPERYNVIVVGFEPMGSPDGILEPGEEFGMRNITLFNNGSLPTPVPHSVIISVVDTEWVELVAGPVRVPDAILPGHSITLSHLPPVRFRLRHNFRLVPNVIPSARPTITFDMWVARVNKRFRRIEQAERFGVEVRTRRLLRDVCLFSRVRHVSLEEAREP